MPYADAVSYSFRRDGVLELYDHRDCLRHYFAPLRWVEVVQTGKHHDEHASRRRDVWSGGAGRVYLQSEYSEKDDPDLKTAQDIEAEF